MRATRDTGDMIGLDDVYRYSRRAAVAAAITAAGGAVSVGCDPVDTQVEPPALAPFEATVPADFVPHRSRTAKVAVRTPKSWKESPTSGVVDLYLFAGRPGSSLCLTVVPLSPGESLNGTMANLPNDLRHEFADFKLVKNDLVVLNDLPAGRIVYEASRGGVHRRLMLVVINKGATSYSLTYAAPADRYDEERAVAEKVLASLKLP